MALKAQIEADLKAALLGGDRFKTEVLRGLKSAIQYQEVAEKKREEGLSDTGIEQLFAKEAKKRDESAELFERGGNQEAANKERAEKELILQYLPKQLDEAEVRVVVEEAVAQTGATSMQDMGKVIGVVKSKVGNSADGALIARIVKETISK
ncbi:GatB/YqeY [Candidatus Saccharibacteria bacterium]|nr:MAG: GatB/YqeY [Candidatus Saccharibacteria bacterium]